MFSVSQQSQVDHVDRTSNIKLKYIEAQRIMVVLQELTRKVQLIAYLDSATLPAELAPVQPLFSEYTALNKAVVSGTADPGQVDALHAVTRRLIRELSNRFPAGVTLPQPTSKKGSDALVYLVETLHLMETVVFRHLLSSSEEDRVRQAKITSVTRKEEKLSREIKVLREQQEKVRDERQRELDIKQELIQRLKNELKDIETQAEDQASRVISRSKQKQELEQQQFEFRHAELTGSTVELDRSLMEARVRHRDEEQQLRKRRGRVENELEAWILKFDTEMTEKQTEFDELQAVYWEEEKNLHEVVVKYEAVAAEWKIITDERQRKEDAIKAQQEMEKQRNKAASKIQALWRGHVVRRGPRVSSGKKSADKKSKKKKK